MRSLLNLDVGTSTGTDGISARVLKACCKELVIPLILLIKIILCSGRWPALWCHHRICPLFKKGAVYNPSNSRGVHITSQLAKTVERVILELSRSFIRDLDAFGEKQFVYRREHGSRDALLWIIMLWLIEIYNGRKILVLLSDVSGAFDRVRRERLTDRLAQLGFPLVLVRLFDSWLRPRTAHVSVDGADSGQLAMSNQVYQGTVLGPSLWNIYFAPIGRRIQANCFQYSLYADDLISFLSIPNEVDTEDATIIMENVQSSIHKWGAEQQISLDESKESMHIISRVWPAGGSFKLLGITFDERLDMHLCVRDTVVKCNFKLRMLLRSRRFFCDRDMVNLFKAQILSYVEYRSSSLFHASATTLRPVDMIQTRFLSDFGINIDTALLVFNLAPLRTRRDIAALGIIHRAAMGKGPKQLLKLLVREDPQASLEETQFSYTGQTSHALCSRFASLDLGECQGLQFFATRDC